MTNQIESMDLENLVYYLTKKGLSDNHDQHVKMIFLQTRAAPWMLTCFYSCTRA
jgi:hypothetical protein